MAIFVSTIFVQWDGAEEKAPKVVAAAWRSTERASGLPKKEGPPKEKGRRKKARRAARALPRHRVRMGGCGRVKTDSAT